MREVFVDADYWIARIDPRDDLHYKAVTATTALRQPPGAEGILLVTTDGVLSEALAGAAAAGDRLHRAMASLIANRIHDANVRVLFSTPARLQRGLDIYRERLGHFPSLHDCISKAIVEERGIVEVLSYDADFRDLGCRCLLRDD